MQNDNNELIKRFVRDTLGCTCSDEVFNSIALEHGYTRQDNTFYDTRLLVGNRLLIYLLNFEFESVANLQDRLPEALLAGKHERDNKGLNRFRVVIVTEYQSELAMPARQLFEESPARDDKTHLHIIQAADVPAMLWHSFSPVR